MNKSLTKKECWKVLNKKIAQVILIYLYDMLWAIIEKKNKKKLLNVKFVIFGIFFYSRSLLRARRAFQLIKTNIILREKFLVQKETLTLTK